MRRFRMNRAMFRRLGCAAMAAVMLNVTACSGQTAETAAVSTEAASVEETPEEITIDASESSGEQEYSGVYENAEDGGHAILADGEKASYKDAKVVKTGEAEGDEADFYGENAAVFATNGASLDLDNMDITTVDLRSLRRRIGAVTQDGSLFQGDIYSNIVISAPQLTLKEAWEAAEIAGIADDIRAMPMGMHTIISEGQGGISGGQKQRLMIARAVAPKPKILIFDEATSALDNKTQKKVSEALDALRCTRIWTLMLNSCDQSKKEEPDPFSVPQDSLQWL